MNLTDMAKTILELYKQIRSILWHDERILTLIRVCTDRLLVHLSNAVDFDVRRVWRVVLEHVRCAS